MSKAGGCGGGEALPGSGGGGGGGVAVRRVLEAVDVDVGPCSEGVPDDEEDAT